MKLTDARRRGLAVLAARHPGPARESNVTDLPAGFVYWQTLNWLVESGLAVITVWDGRSRGACLTPKGVELAREEGLLR